jgi:rhodanese-related sulfurtransferase
MDTTNTPAFSVSPSDLVALLREPNAPLLIDVRKVEAFATSEIMLPGALRRDPALVAQWAAALPASDAVLVYCVHGHEVSASTVAALRERGINASFLCGGIAAWREQGRPLLAKAAGSNTRWVTRERPKIDRIACPWLIRRFVDAQAQFLYVPTDQVATVAQTQNATAYDVTPKVAQTLFTHLGERCSFDAFIAHYHLGQDAALGKLALIVRGADTDRLGLAPESAGLLALSLGMSRQHADDHAMLEAMLPVYDALYAWCRDRVAGQHEAHNWKP